MRKKNKRRIHSAIGYYGFGNISAVFNRRPKPIFEKIKTIYGDGMERYSLEHGSALKFHQDISKEELKTVLNVIRRSEKRARKKEFLKQGSFLVLIAIVLIVCYNLL